MIARRPLLLFRATCPYCRGLAWLARLLSVGVLRCEPIGGEAAQALYELHPQSRGKLALFGQQGVETGTAVLAAAPRVVLDDLFDRLLGRRVA